MAIAQKFQASLIAKGLSVQFFSGMALGKERQVLVVSLEPIQQLTPDYPLPAIVWEQLAEAKIMDRCLVITFCNNKFSGLQKIKGVYEDGDKVYPEIVDYCRSAYLTHITLDKAVKWLS